MSDPVLRNWRLIAFKDSSRLGIFLGEVTNHPLLNDGWIITSPVRWISDDRNCTRTESRLYKLGDEFPRDQPLPEKPRNILFTRLFENFGKSFGVATLEQLGELMEYANHLCGPLSSAH
ncbi:MAG: hypothetical protein EPN75_08885 [Beijerinckiaceae bacterium]|nr:MAG: hypothetical protein EPN75_08885 [Beijerinckiaceae bacterium]